MGEDNSMTDSGFRVDAQAGPGGPSSPDPPLPSGPLRNTFVMGGISCAGSRQCISHEVARKMT